MPVDVKKRGRKKYTTYERGRSEELKAKREERQLAKEVRAAEAMAHQINDGKLRVKFASKMTAAERAKYALERMPDKKP